MTTIALFCGEKKQTNLLGFLLLADKDEIPFGESQRECVLTGFPFALTQEENRLTEFFNQYKYHEFTCSINKSDENVILEFQAENSQVTITIHHKQGGEWCLLDQDQQTTFGYCEFAQK